MAMKIWALIGLAILCGILTVQADNDGSTPPPSGSPPSPTGDSSEESQEGHHPRHRHHPDKDHFEEPHKDDEDDFYDCDDDKEEYEDGKEGKDKEDMEYEKPAKGKHCGKKKIAKICIIIAVCIVVLGTGAGIAFCVIRHNKLKSRNVSDSKTNLHVPGNRENVYVVAETPAYPQEKPNNLSFPVVSHEPLPGKE